MKDLIEKALIRASEIDCGSGEAAKRRKMYTVLSAVAVEAELSPGSQLQLRCSLQLFDSRIPKRKVGFSKRAIN